MDCLLHVMDYINARLVDFETLCALELSCSTVREYIDKRYKWRIWFLHAYSKQFLFLSAMIGTPELKGNWKRHFMSQKFGNLKCGYQTARVPEELSPSGVKNIFLLTMGCKAAGKRVLNNACCYRGKMRLQSCTLSDERGAFLSKADCLVIIVPVELLQLGVEEAWKILEYKAAKRDNQRGSSEQPLPVIFALNKMDLVDGFIDFNYWMSVIVKEHPFGEKLKHLRDHLPYIEISAKEKINVDVLYQTASMISHSKYEECKLM